MGLTLADVYPDYAAPAGWGDKGTAHDYLPTYQREITRTTGVTLCEIGVYMGHSIAMWQDWLTDSTVVGLDIDLSLITFPHPNLYEVDATNGADVADALGDMTFDYVIDDGSHYLAEQLGALAVFLPRMNPGGRYFIEDITGDAALGALVAAVQEAGRPYRIYDGRGEGRQPDEIMLIIGAPDDPTW